MFSEDVTNDLNKNNNSSFRDRSKYFMKFRGNTAIVATYIFMWHDGMIDNNHYTFTNYSPVDYTDKGDPGKEFHTKEGRVIGGRWGGSEVKAYLNYHMIAPFLTLKHPLFKNNNIKFSLHYEISPITMNVGMSVTLTPIAFLTFQSGFLIGPGWSFAGIISGIGINDKGSILRQNFIGPHMQLWFSSTFQFDLAYVISSRYIRWLHFVLVLTPTIRYQALLSINEHTPYMYEEDIGENLNGWKLQGEYLLGYRIPVIEDYTGEDRQFLKMKHKNLLITAGIVLRMDYLHLSHFYDSRMKDKGWGSDFCFIEFGPGVNIELPYNYYVTLFALFKNDRFYTSDTVGNLDYREREYQDWYVYFRRIGFFFGWNF